MLGSRSAAQAAGHRGARHSRTVRTDRTGVTFRQENRGVRKTLKNRELKSRIIRSAAGNQRKDSREPFGEAMGRPTGPEGFPVSGTQAELLLPQHAAVFTRDAGGSGETGRRAGFRVLCRKRRGGSNPPSRIFFFRRPAIAADPDGSGWTRRDVDQKLPRGDLTAGFHADIGDGAGDGGFNGLFHFHGFQHQQRLSRIDGRPR